MKLVIVYLCCATLAEILMKGMRRESRDSNDWIYRRLWNDTVSDCWSLRSPAWSAAGRNNATVVGTQHRDGLAQARRWAKKLGHKIAAWGFRRSLLHPAKQPKVNRPRMDKGRRRIGPSRMALPQPRIVHIRATTGLLGWLSPLLGQGKRLNG